MNVRGKLNGNAIWVWRIVIAATLGIIITVGSFFSAWAFEKMERSVSREELAAVVEKFGGVIEKQDRKIDRRADKTDDGIHDLNKKIDEVIRYQRDRK